jgi:hypothetical protein
MIITEVSCYAAKLYSHKFLNSCGTGILPVSFIQIKCTTAYDKLEFLCLYIKTVFCQDNLDAFPLVWH